MPKTKKKPTSSNVSDATVGYEAQLWQMADALHDGMRAAIAANLRELGFWKDAL